MEELFCIEIFAGSGRLTCELCKVGLSDSVGVDHQVGKCLTAPIIKLDFQDPEARKLDMLDNRAASRARTIPRGRSAPEPRKVGQLSRWLARPQIRVARLLTPCIRECSAPVRTPADPSCGIPAFGKMRSLMWNPCVPCSIIACGEEPDVNSLV